MTWFLAITVIFILHCLTLKIPAIWYDESEIVDYGRVFFEQNTDWAIHWRDNRPIILLTYLGGVFQELSFRLFNLSIITI